MNGYKNTEGTRIRCGKVHTFGEKGFKEGACSDCGAEKDVLGHIWTCNEAKRLIKRDVSNWIKKNCVADRREDDCSRNRFVA